MQVNLVAVSSSSWPNRRWRAGTTALGWTDGTDDIFATRDVECPRMKGVDIGISPAASPPNHFEFFFAGTGGRGGVPDRAETSMSGA